MKKTNRNRTAGHVWERTIVLVFKALDNIVPEVGTARLLSKYYDDRKIDIVTTVIDKMQEFGLAIQAKTTTIVAPYPKLLNELKVNLKKLKLVTIPVVFHKHTKRVGNRFMPKGNYAILDMEDFIKIFVKMSAYQKGYELLNTYFDCLPDEDKEEVNKKLEEWGLTDTQ